MTTGAFGGPDIGKVAPTGLDAGAVFAAWHDAIQWADQLIRLM